MTRLGIVLAVALPIFAMAEEAEKETPVAPPVIEKAEPRKEAITTPPPAKKAIAKPAPKPKKPAKRKDGKLLNIAKDGTITYHVDRDSAVRAIVAKLQEEKALREKNETILVNELDRLRGKLLRIESNCKKKG